MPTTTHDKIQALIKSGLTISEIARKSGISQPTVWRIANGQIDQPKEGSVLAIDRVYRSRIKGTPENSATQGSAA